MPLRLSVRVKPKWRLCQREKALSAENPSKSATSVGLPLPLMSYGGSIMMSTMFGIGLLLNAYVHRDQMPSRLTPKL